MGESSELHKGDIVDYHSIIGGPVTSTGHVVEVVGPMPNPYGVPVAWVSGIAGCVSMKALTRSKQLSSTGSELSLSEVVDACYTAIKLASESAPAGVIDSIGDKVLLLGMRVAALAELAAEVRTSHADKDSCDYNDCDKDRCQWCCEFDEIVHGTVGKKVETGK